MNRGRSAWTASPEALARSVEVVRTRGHLTAHLRAPLPPAMHVRAWTLREASSGADAIEVTLHCPVHLGPAGVLALHWAPGISVEVELHASPVTADARVPQLPEAPPLTVDEQDVLVDAVLIAADGPLPWNEALPRELRRISGTATGRRAAARVWTVDPICALADLMTGDGGAPLRTALATAIQDREHADAITARLPRRVRRLLPAMGRPRLALVAPKP